MQHSLLTCFFPFIFLPPSWAGPHPPPFPHLFKIPLSHSLRRRFNTYTLITSTFHAPIGRCITSARSTFIPHPSLLFKIAQHTLLVEKTPSTCNICEDSDTTPFYVSNTYLRVTRVQPLSSIYVSITGPTLFGGKPRRFCNAGSSS